MPLLAAVMMLAPLPKSDPKWSIVSQQMMMPQSPFPLAVSVLPCDAVNPKMASLAAPGHQANCPRCCSSAPAPHGFPASIDRLTSAPLPVFWLMMMAPLRMAVALVNTSMPKADCPGWCNR